MNRRLLQGFLAGYLRAVILVIIMFIMKAAGMGNPGFVGMYRSTFGAHPPIDKVIAALLFIICLGFWVNSVIGKPLFNDFTAKGILMPVVFDMVIWGSFVGWYMRRKVGLVTMR
jgi:hypothetical protein